MDLLFDLFLFNASSLTIFGGCTITILSGCIAIDSESLSYTYPKPGLLRTLSGIVVPLHLSGIVVPLHGSIARLRYVLLAHQYLEHIRLISAEAATSPIIDLCCSKSKRK